MELTDEEILNSLKQENEIFKNFNATLKKFDDSTKNIYSYLFLSLSFVLICSIISLMAYFSPKDEWWVTYLVLSLFFLFFLFLRLSSFSRVHYARKNFNQFKDLLETKKILSEILFPTNLAPMRKAYVFTKLRSTISSLTTAQRKILINVYLKEGEQLKNNNWYIITLLGIMQFAVWTGYISAVIGHEDSLNGMTMYLMIFMIISLGLTIYVYIYKIILESLVLKRSNNYFLLTEIISTIDVLDDSAPQPQSIPVVHAL
ncbi:hypothetical protein [Paenibacillus sp. NPDC058177]|uniref:hypothetical protein n=1 Tax=Paenibacillus sp. NPDC058177 TaxID=3346369 RepID=UPI0036DC41AF